MSCLEESFVLRVLSSSDRFLQLASFFEEFYCIVIRSIRTECLKQKYLNRRLGIVEDSIKIARLK